MKPQKTTKAYLAGGCFWGMEDLFRQLPGVKNTEVGYMGGDLKNPGYHDVKTGSTGHAESLLIEFDASQITYEDLLLFFFKVHDPTTSNRQGNDIGTQYRSAIFFVDDSQKLTAEKVINRVDKSKAWGSPAVTTLEPFQKFYPAEKEHQDYLQRYPDGYTCHFIRKVIF